MKNPTDLSEKVSVSCSVSCLTLCDPMDCSPRDSSVHGIVQARILEWVAIFLSRESFFPGIKPRYPVLKTDSLPSGPTGKQGVGEFN